MNEREKEKGKRMKGLLFHNDVRINLWFVRNTGFCESQLDNWNRATIFVFGRSDAVCVKTNRRRGENYSKKGGVKFCHQCDINGRDKMNCGRDGTTIVYSWCFWGGGEFRDGTRDRIDYYYYYYYWLMIIIEILLTYIAVRIIITIAAFRFCFCFVFAGHQYVVVVSTYRMSGSGPNGSCAGRCSGARCRTYPWIWASNGTRACWSARSGASGRRRWICSWARSGSPRSGWAWTRPCRACDSEWSPAPSCRRILRIAKRTENNTKIERSRPLTTPGTRQWVGSGSR